MSINAAAARVIARHARDGAETLELLDMLGLLAEDGRIAPDDLSRPVVLVDVAAGKGQVVSDSITRRPKQSTAPEGLRELPPVVIAPKSSARRENRVVKTDVPSPHSLTASPKVRKVPPKRPRTPSVCATDSGYKKHIRNKEPACDPCRKAHAARNAMYAVPGPRKQYIRADCGSQAGYDAHRSRNERICEPCKAAHNEKQRDRRRRAATQEGRDFQPRRTVAPCGTASGCKRHYKNGEKPCDPCKAAKYAEDAVYRARKKAS